jgi:hypothetical protein
MSFSGETIYTVQLEQQGSYKVNSFYKVFSDASKTVNNPIRYPISVCVSDISPSVYSILYTELKSIYPGSTDVDPVKASGPPIDPTIDPEVPKRTNDETQFGTEVLARAEQYLASNPSAYELQNVYSVAEQNFYTEGLASTNEMNQILQLLDGNITAASCTGS